MRKPAGRTRQRVIQLTSFPKLGFQVKNTIQGKGKKNEGKKNNTTYHLEAVLICTQFVPGFLVDTLSHSRINLTVREGRTGEYWPEVVAVLTSLRSVCTKMAEDQYSFVRLELPRLGSSLLYGTRAMLICFLLKYTSGHLN